MIIEQVRTRVKGDPIGKAEYQTLFNALEDVRNPRDPQWIQAWILLNCATRNRAFATQRLLSRYNRQTRKRGTEAEYYEFLRVVQDDMGFYLPNGSSYTKSFRSADVPALMGKCQELATRLAELDLDVFANSGTLLGLVREGTLLEHDNDIDLAVILDARSEAEAGKEWIALCNRLIALDVAVARSTWSKVTLKLKDIGSFGVDLFPAWVGADDRLFVYPHTYGTLTGSQLTPLSVNEATGLKLPSDPEAMLASNYGEDWRVPNEGWTFAWKPANENFADFISAVEVAAS